MQDKTKARLAMGLFLTACLIPSLGMLLPREETVAANQNLQPAPRLTTVDGEFNTQVLQDTSLYLADHLAFRQEIITAAAKADAAVFHTSLESQVTLGREGWLFYTETIADYLRTEPMTDRQLYGAAHALALLREYVEGQGARLFFTVAPNKASLYPQYLPNLGTSLAEEGNMARLRPWLEGEGVSYIDLFAPFQSREEILYYRTDSHWTSQGAALAADTLLLQLQGAEGGFFTGGFHAGEGHKGDLYEMLYPAGDETEETQEPDRPFTFEWTRPIRSAEDQRIDTRSAAGQGRILVFRDSFGNDLYPYLAQAYQEAAFSRAMPYQASLLDGQDTVLIELVERNLPWLATRPPVFPAPERELGEGAAGTAVVQVTSQEDASLSGYAKLEGTLSGPVDEASPIYVRLGERCFEATPAGNDWNNGVPFTVYIPEELAGEDLQILYMENGVLAAARPARERNSAT